MSNKSIYLVYETFEYYDFWLAKQITCDLQISK